MQPPMPVIVGASTALVGSLFAIGSAPFFSAASRTSFAGRVKRMAKPQAQGPCFAAKSEANESGCSLTRKLHSPWRYSVTAFDLCFATAVKPSFGNNSCSNFAFGAANSTNSKPSTPIGFSNVVGRMPILGWALMGISDQRISNAYSNARCLAGFGMLWKRSERREVARRRSAGTGAYTSVREDSEHRRRASCRAQQLFKSLSMLVAFDQFCIGIGVEQFFQLVFGFRVGLDDEKPAVAIGVFIDRFGLIAERFVDRDHFTADRRIHVRGGLDRFHDRAGVAGFDVVADVGQFDVHQIAQLRLRMIGDAHAHLVGVFDARPFVGLQEFQIAGYLAHVRSLVAVGRFYKV